MKTLIYSHLWTRPGSSPEITDRLRALLNLWLSHLRGPGGYSGDVVLFTNLPDIHGPGLKLLTFENVPADPRRAFLHRVLHYAHVPVRDYDVAMQMDLDILAIRNVSVLFPSDERLWAAPSRLQMLHWRHAWTLLPRWRRAFHKYTGWRRREMGACACVVASATSAWERNFGAWAGLIREHGDREPPSLADQSFLNLLLLKRTVPLACWSPDLIRHDDWDNPGRACLLHFPGRGKEVMLKYRLV